MKDTCTSLQPFFWTAQCHVLATILQRILGTAGAEFLEFEKGYLKNIFVYNNLSHVLQHYLGLRYTKG